MLKMMIVSLVNSMPIVGYVVSVSVPFILLCNSQRPRPKLPKSLRLKPARNGPTSFQVSLCTSRDNYCFNVSELDACVEPVLTMTEAVTHPHNKLVTNPSH